MVLYGGRAFPPKISGGLLCNIAKTKQATKTMHTGAPRSINLDAAPPSAVHSRELRAAPRAGRAGDEGESDPPQSPASVRALAPVSSSSRKF